MDIGSPVIPPLKKVKWQFLAIGRTDIQSKLCNKAAALQDIDNEYFFMWRGCVMI